MGIGIGFGMLGIAGIPGIFVPFFAMSLAPTV